MMDDPKARMSLTSTKSKASNANTVRASATDAVGVLFVFWGGVGDEPDEEGAGREE
jgi:hypothetical protein